MVSMVYLPRPLGLVAHQRLFNFSPVICTRVGTPIAHYLPSGRILDSAQEKMLNRIAPSIAAQKPATSNPGTTVAAAQKSSALITSRKSPRVRTVTGSVRMTRNG